MNCNGKAIGVATAKRQAIARCEWGIRKGRPKGFLYLPAASNRFYSKHSRCTPEPVARWPASHCRHLARLAGRTRLKAPTRDTRSVSCTKVCESAEGLRCGAKVCASEAVGGQSEAVGGQSEAVGGQSGARFVPPKRLAGGAKRLAGPPKQLAGAPKPLAAPPKPLAAPPKPLAAPPTQLARLRKPRFVLRTRLAGLRKPLAVLGKLWAAEIERLSAYALT